MLVKKKREDKKKLNHEVYVTFRVSGVAFCRQEEHVFSEEDYLTSDPLLPRLVHVATF